MTERWRGRHVFDYLKAGIIEGVPLNILGTQFFVSANDGNDGNVGTSPDKPLLTLERARALNNALIDWAHDAYKMNVIWVEPGIYDEYFTGGFYYAHIVGLGTKGTDTMAEIHPSSVGGVFRENATLLGTNFLNMRFESDIQDVPIFDLGICNNSKILDCEFMLGKAVTGVKAIDLENCGCLTVERTDFSSQQAEELDYAIYARGGVNKFFENCRIRDNNIFAKTCGIYTAIDCRAHRSMIRQNFIQALGTGHGVRILDLVAPTAYVVENDIVVEGAGTAIEHTQGTGYTLRNHTLVNGAYALVTA